ncbi:MAG TPA: DUF192 domain-containing protein [Dehalococcoidia bacterium]|nr:DUF192 domain-containing protein [Dehalococcoidia bacterium]
MTVTEVKRSRRGEFRVLDEEGRVVVERLHVARSHWQRFSGLMLRRDFPTEEGILFPGGDIHGFFMRFPLDLLFVDDDGVILKAVRGLRPWRIARTVRGAKGVIELKARPDAEYRVGQRLRFEPREHA